MTHVIQEWLFAAALVSSLVGMAGLYVSIASQRNQLAVQIMLQYSEKFRLLLLAVPAEMLSSRYDPGIAIEPSLELTRLALSLFYLLLELNYLLEKRYLSMAIWHLWLPTVRVALRNPFFLREWELLRPDFLHHPSFCRFIASLQK